MAPGDLYARRDWTLPFEWALNREQTIGFTQPDPLGFPLGSH